MSNRTTTMPQRCPTEAGRKLRAWREAQIPPLGAHDAARWLGLSYMSIYRLEWGTHPAGGKIKLALIERGICTREDFDRPAIYEIAVCPLCERREGDPVNAGCSEPDCPRKRSA